jgi:phage terminase large subunit GpA-like protein
MNEQYSQYLQTEHWRNLKTAARHRWGKVCCVCGEREGFIDCHHLFYRDLYDVKTRDVRIVCRECHDLIHKLFKAGLIRKPGCKNFKKQAKRFWWRTLKAVLKHYGIYNKSLSHLRNSQNPRKVRQLVAAAKGSL